MATRTITLEIEYIDHYTTVLKNKNGDSFTFNPETRNGEELTDFLMGAE